MNIGRNHRRLPTLFVPERAAETRPARRRVTRALTRERESVHETWRCVNRACGVWTKPSEAHRPDCCHVCDTPRTSEVR